MTSPPATLAAARGGPAATSPAPTEEWPTPSPAGIGVAVDRPPRASDAGERANGATAAATDLAVAPPPPPAERKAKKRKRKDASGPTGPPRPAGDGDCRALIYGSQARAAIELRPVRFIRLLDIQNLVLWILGEGSNPSKWAFVKNKALVERVVLVAVPGLDVATWRAKRSALPFLGAALGEPVTVLAQRADVWQSQSARALFSVPETRKAKAAKAGAPNPPPPPPPHPPAHYALTADQLRICEFPLLVEAEEGGTSRPPDGYLASQPRGPAHDPAAHPVIALDCEMCETAAGFEVTRVSLVDGGGGVLLDELVLPHAPIIAYHTRFSGITPAMLEGVTTRLASARAAVLAHLAADTLLVGHGLENDLRALRIVHTAIIDTSVLFPHPRGLPSRTALRRLAATFLKKNIQGGEHDSVEDARVALALARLKFKHGPAFGAEAPDKGEKLLAVLGELGRTASLVDRPDAINRLVAGRANALPCATDREAVARACKEAAASSTSAGPAFLWTQLTDLDAHHRRVAEARRAEVEAWAQRRAAAGGDEGEAAADDPLPPLHDGVSAGGPSADGPPSTRGGGGSADEAAPADAILAALDDGAARLHAACPPNTLFILATCQGDTHDTRRLQQQAYRRAQGLDGLPPWSPAAEAHLDALRERGMQGLCFCDVTR